MADKTKETEQEKAPKMTRKARGHKVTQDMTGALVQVINLPLAFVAPDYALTQVESDALTVALADLAAQNALVANLIYNLVTVQKYGEMPIVLSAIMINKLVVAKKMPEFLADPAQGVLEAVASQRKSGSEPAKKRARKVEAETPSLFDEEQEHVESGKSSDGDRPDGQRQEQPGERDTEAA